MTSAEKIKAKILDLAIRGKLVPQDTSDEPAAKLLERIKDAKAKLVKEGKRKREIPLPEIAADEIPFEIPASWKWVRLRELGEFSGGHTPSLADSSNWENGTVLWVTSKDMKQKYIRDTGCKVSDKGAKELHLLPSGSLIMVTRSGILRRTFPIALAAKPLTINQDQRALEFYEDIGEFVYAVLKGLEQKILKEYRKTGTTVESIIWEKFIDLPIPLPPLAEQKRIVAKIEELFSYADKISETGKAIKSIADRIDRKILDLAIRGKLVPQDASDEPAAKLLERIKDAKAKLVKEGKRKREKTLPEIAADEIPFEIPASWMWVRLGEVGDWGSGATPSRKNPAYYENGTVPWLKTGDLNDGLITDIPEFITVKALKETSVHLNPIGTVLIAMYGATIGKVGTLGIEATTNQACCACRCNGCIDPRYLFHHLISQRAYFRELGGGGAQPNISKEIIVRSLIPLPPLAEQKRIVAKIEELRAMLKTLQR